MENIDFLHTPHFRRQKKALSQVFLQVLWPCERMVSELKKHRVTQVLEIGPGSGILTKLLVKDFGVTAIEKDPRFVSDLRTLYRGQDHIQIICQDILNFDWLAWKEKYRTSTLAIVGNIPYQITMPIFGKLLEILSKIAIGLLLIQREVAERLTAKPNTKAYGCLSISAQLRSHIKVLYQVHRSCFFPVPKVDSSIVALWSTEKTSKYCLKEVEQLVHLAFRHRRKQLANSLKPLSLDLSSYDFDFKRRPENLSIEEFIKLQKLLK